MGLRFRRSARLGPLRFNFTASGLSSISLGGPGASFNLPVNRRGGPRTTIGLPGTGMSWTVESTPAGGAAFPAGAASGLPNSRRLRSSQLESLRQTLLGMLQQQLFANGGLGAPLWEANLVSRLLADGSLPARIAGQLATIETPEALEAYLQRAQSQADARRRAQRCIEAVQRARELAAARGWLP